MGNIPLDGMERPRATSIVRESLPLRRAIECREVDSIGFEPGNRIVARRTLGDALVSTRFASENSRSCCSGHTQADDRHKESHRP